MKVTAHEDGKYNFELIAMPGGHSLGQFKLAVSEIVKNAIKNFNLSRQYKYKMAQVAA